MIHVRTITHQDLEPLTEAMAVLNKPLEQFEAYYLEHLQNQRVVFVALWQTGDTQVMVGYVTLLWQSLYTQFWRRRVPEIVDLNAHPDYRQRGIGSALIHACEAHARQAGYTRMGISVVMDDPDYAAARRLYPHLGYEPDGFGITPYDNELHLWKDLFTSMDV